jgi:hypothetical protein
VWPPLLRVLVFVCNPILAFVCWQGVCRQREPLLWFLVLPLYPCTLRRWLEKERLSAVSCDSSPREWRRRVLPVIRQLLQGLAYLHRVFLAVVNESALQRVVWLCTF